MEPKIPEVSSGFPRGTSERLQAWSQQVQRTVVGNWVIIKSFYKAIIFLIALVGPFSSLNSSGDSDACPQAWSLRTMPLGK